MTILCHKSLRHLKDSKFFINMTLMQCASTLLCIVVYEHSKVLMFCSYGLWAIHDNLTAIMLVKISHTPMRLTGFLEREKGDYESINGNHESSQSPPITSSKVPEGNHNLKLNLKNYLTWDLGILIYFDEWDKKKEEKWLLRVFNMGSYLACSSPQNEKIVFHN